ncbi:MAG: 6-pyruvoyl tetrahydropterin synthase family protein [Chitinophagaceae bacterium]|nr:6-pyruvoyl tetrahydropterin synthase family protein [Chitinophagaceae bacterium]
MLKLTKIFHFEMAHAIHGHTGNCKNIHGHSYELHVTVSTGLFEPGFIPAPGFIMDFKEIKNMVREAVIEKFDHSLLLSRRFMAANPSLSSLQNLVIFDEEPTAENLLLYFKQVLQQLLNDKIKLVRLLLFETKDSYAEWTAGQLCEY